MTNMDHSEAVRLQAAEKYLLGELPKEQHAAFEEHFFECSACAEEMRATVAFMESSRQVAREAVPQTINDKRLVPVASGAGGWFGWLRPAFAVPVFAALLMFIGYQNVVTIHNLKQSPANVIIGDGAKSFSLLSAGSRGGSAAKFAVGAHEDFRLEVDMPGNSPSGYTCQIQDDSGKVLASFAVSPEEAKNTITRVIRGGSLKPGLYTLVVFRGETLPARAENKDSADQISFVVEFVP
jgi:Putative zinc-finger